VAPTREVVRARWGVTIMFWLNGVGFASLLPRYPEIKAALGLGDLGWGLVVGLGQLGGPVDGLVTARLIRRFSSARVNVVTALLGLAMLSVYGNATVWPVFALGTFAMAGLDAVSDISMNAHGLVADAVDLRWALIVLPVAAVVGLALSPSLTPPHRS